MGSEAELAAVLAKAGPAHHQAFIATDGDDPEWPLWYADHIVEAVRRITGNPGVTVSELVYLLIDSDRTFKSRVPDDRLMSTPRAFGGVIVPA